MTNFITLSYMKYSKIREINFKIGFCILFVLSLSLYQIYFISKTFFNLNCAASFYTNIYIYIYIYALFYYAH